MPVVTDILERWPDAEPSDSDAAALPETFWGAVRAELRRAFTAPYEAPVVVLVNALLMTGAWFLLPPDGLFRVHKEWFFPLALQSWMIADVPATNILGSDARRMSAALDRPAELRRMLVAKSLVLWLLVAPPCVVVAVVLGYRGEPALWVMATIAAVVCVPLGALAVAAWIGILYPYHAIRLRLRWDNRRPHGRMVVRWLVLVVTPYLVVPLIADLILLPVLLGWRLSSGSWIPDSDQAFILGAFGFAVTAALGWFGGHAVAVRLVGRRAEKLRTFLADPTRG